MTEETNRNAQKLVESEAEDVQSGATSQRVFGDSTTSIKRAPTADEIAARMAEALPDVPCPDWLKPKQLAGAIALSLGATKKEAAAFAQVDTSTLWRWLTHEVHGRDFKKYIDELTYRTGLASRPVRLRAAKRMAGHLLTREYTDEGAQKRHTSLDWFKHIAELAGESEPPPLPPAAMGARGVFIGTQINVGAVMGAAECEDTVMSPPEAGDFEILEAEDTDN